MAPPLSCKTQFSGNKESLDVAHRNQIQIEMFIDSPANTTVGDITCIDRKVIVAHFLTARTL